MPVRAHGLTNDGPACQVTDGSRVLAAGCLEVPLPFEAPARVARDHLPPYIEDA